MSAFLDALERWLSTIVACLAILGIGMSTLLRPDPWADWGET